MFVQLFCSIIQIEAAQPEKKLGLSRPNPSLKRQAHWQSQAYFGNPQRIGLSRLNPKGGLVSHQSRVLAYRDTYGQAQGCSGVHQGSSVDVSCLLWASPGICYLRAIGYFSMSQCATGTAMESSVGPRKSQMEQNKPEHLLLPYDHCPVNLHP